ncbi:MAG: phosphatidate cytidylyltransferase, partial [Bacteroidales bacterium]
MKNKELITRSLTGLVLVAVLCAAIYLGAWTTAALFLVIMCIGLHEWQNLMHKVGLNPNTFGMYILAILSYFWFCGKTLPIPWSYEAYCLVEIGLPALIIWCVLFIFISALFKKAERPMENIAVTLTGAIYIGIPFALLNFIINPFSNDGGAYPNILFGFFLLIWSSDVFAYLVGRSLGKHKLCERLSPSKTWEGVLGGLVATLGIAYLWSLYAIELNTEMWLLLA